MSNVPIIILAVIGLQFGATSGISAYLGNSTYELPLIFTGMVFAIAAYALVSRNQPKEPEINPTKYQDYEEEPEEFEEERKVVKISRKERIQLIKDILGRRNSSGVEMLTGEPRFAVFFISMILLLPYLATQINVFVDTMWVSYLGSGGIAAIGVVKVFYSFVVCIANGIGIGGSNRISFYIGRNDMESAKRIATNTIMLGIMASIVITVFLLLFMDPMLELMGAADAKDMAMQYAIPLNVCTIFTILSGVILNIMRAEGAVGKVTLAVFISVIVNIIVDPLLIFEADMGVAGAGWATSIANFCILQIGVYWYHSGKMELKFRLLGRYDRRSGSEINQVAIPRALEEQYSTSMFLVQRIILLATGGAAFIAIQEAGFTYISLLQAVPLAVGGAVLSVCSAAAGQRDKKKFTKGLVTAMNMLVVISMFFSIYLFLRTDVLISLFIHGDTYQYQEIIIWTARLYCVILPIYSISKLASYIMQVLKKQKQSSRIKLIQVGVRMVFLIIPVLLGYTHYEAIAYAIVAGYLFDAAVMVGPTLYYYAKADFEKEITA